MKTLFKFIILVAIMAVSCNTKTNKNEEIKEETTELYACPMHPEVTGKQGEKCSRCGMELTKPVASENPDNRPGNPVSKKDIDIRAIVASYLSLKNALAADDDTKAAAAGKALKSDMETLDRASFTEEQSKVFNDVAPDMEEHAGHIADNAGNIDHQREHFVVLSKDIDDLLAVFGSPEKLYKDFCPMADNNKGAIWISETKEIKNPYFGKKMATCGNIKKEY